LGAPVWGCSSYIRRIESDFDSFNRLGEVRSYCRDLKEGATAREGGVYRLRVFWSRTMSTRTPLNLSGTERAELERVARRPSTPQALAKRCRVILLDDREDMTYAEIGEELAMREQTVL
jgi:hypothetical protein